MEEKQELVGIKLLKQGISIGKRTSTPSPTWRFVGFDNSDHLDLPPMTTATAAAAAAATATTIPVSARKIAANLWGGQPLYKIFAGGDGGNNLHRRRRRRHHHHHHIHEDKQSFDDSPKKQTTCYNRGKIQTSSLGIKSSSTELLRVLDRIWSLEQQHTSNVSMIKSLKRELVHSQARIDELVHERKRDHLEMEELRKQLALAEAEKKSHKHSKSLARQHSEAKVSLLNVAKELEGEKRARVLLETLCDEFAKGIRDYEEVVRFLENEPDNRDSVGRENLPCYPDRLVLHVSETWLDERMQMELAEARGDFSGKNMIFESLMTEVETFLEAKRKYDDLLSKKSKGRPSQRFSSESFQVNTEDLNTRNQSEVKTRSNINKTRKMPSSVVETSEIQREGSEDNSLRARLLEARLENHRSRSRRARA